MRRRFLGGVVALLGATASPLGYTPTAHKPTKPSAQWGRAEALESAREGSGRPREGIGSRDLGEGHLGQVRWGGGPGQSPPACLGGGGFPNHLPPPHPSFSQFRKVIFFDLLVKEKIESV